LSKKPSMTSPALGWERLTREMKLADADGRPTPIYPYTDGVGLVGIITSQRTRASHAAFMNDTSEVHHSIRAMRDITNALARACTDLETKEFLGQLDMALAEPLDDPYKLAAVWVACYSEQKDQLSQWRGYGGAEAGYAIEFDAQKLARTAKGQQPPAFLLRCEHDATVYGPVISDAVRLIESLSVGGREDSVRRIGERSEHHS
jgi:hypothetical protein